MDFISYVSGVLATLIGILVITSWRWHCWAHGKHHSTFLLGHVWCGHCAREAIELTHEQRHYLDKFERMLNNE